MANLIFCSDCGDSTGDLSELLVTDGTNLGIETTVVKTGTRSLKIAWPNSSVLNGARVQNILNGAGRRVSVYIRFTAVPANTVQLFGLRTASAVVAVNLTTAGKLQIQSGASTTSTGSALSVDTWYRVTLAYKWTAASNNSFNLYLDDSASTYATLNNTASPGSDPTDLELGQSSSPVTANTTIYYDNIYVDDGSGLDNPSTNGLLVTRKAPNATGTNNAYDTAIGSVTNRWDAVNELPISAGKGWKQAGSSQVIEAYGIQSASQGDVDITGATILGYKAWISAKGQPVTDGTPKTTATNNAKATGTTLTLGPVTVTAGDIIVVLFGDQVGGSAPTINDDIGGNTWTALTGPTTNTARISKWYCIVTNGGSMTVTVTFGSSANARAGALGAWDSSIFGASPLDANPANANDSTSPYDCPATGTLAQADELVLGFCSRASNAALVAGGSELGIIEAHSSGSGGAGANISVGLTYRKVTATTSIQPQMTGSSVAGVAGTASFKITPIVAGTPKLVDNGTDVAITLSGTQTLYSNHTTTSTYPSNGNTVGMKSSGSIMDSFLYECGIQIAYIPAAGATPLTWTASDNANNLSESLSLGRGNLHTDTLQSLGDAFTFAMGIPMILSDDTNNLADGMVYIYGVTATGSDDLNLLVDALVKLLSYELALADSEAANWADAHQLLLAQFLALSDSNTITDSSVVAMEEREVFADAFTDYFTLSETVEVVPGYAELLSDSLASLSDDYSQILNQLKSFSDSLTLSDSEVHVLELQLAFTESITLSDSLVLGYGLTASETITLTDGFSLGYGLTVSDAISLADASGLDLSYLLSAADTIVLSDSEACSLEYQETFTDSFSLSDDFSRVEEQRLAFSDQATLADNFTVVEGLNEIVEDAISLTDVFSLGYGLLFTDDTDNLADSATVHVITNTIEVDVADSFTLDDFLVLGHGLLSTDSFSLGDSASLNLEYRETASDSIFFTDAEDNQLGLLVTFADDINNFTDSYAQRIEELEAFTDTLATPDDSLVLGFGLLNDDTLVLSDSTSLRSDWFVQSSDTLTQSDSLALEYGLLTTDSFSLSDSVDLNIEHRLTLSDSAANLADSVEVVPGLDESASDSISLGDSTTQLLGYESRQADTIALADTPGLGYGLLFTDDVNLLADSIFTSAPQGPQIFLAFTDSIDNLTDSETNFAAGFLPVSDSVNNLADDYTQQATGRLAVSDSFVITDSVSVNLEQREAFADSFTLTDTERQILEYRLDLSDNAASWADSLATTGSIPLNFSDNGPSFSDSVSLLAAGELAFTETLNLTDSFRKTGEGLLPLDDSITLDDSVDFLLLGPGRDEGLSDSLVLSDAVSILVGNELRIELVFSDTIILTDHYFDLRYPYIPSTRRHIVVSSRARMTIVPDRDSTTVPASDRTTAVPTRDKVIVPRNNRTTTME